MKDVSILFLDHGIPKSDVQASICSLKKLSSLDFYEKIKSEPTDIISNQINDILNKNGVLNNDILNSFIIHHLYLVEFNKVLLSEYPKNYNQFLSLKYSLEITGDRISNIYYIKQHNPEKYKQSYFSIPENRGWLNKFGEEVLTKWDENFTNKRSVFNEIMSDDGLSWHVIELDFCEGSIAECVHKQILESLP